MLYIERMIQDAIAMHSTCTRSEPWRFQHLSQSATQINKKNKATNKNMQMFSRHEFYDRWAWLKFNMFRISLPRSHQPHLHQPDLEPLRGLKWGWCQWGCWNRGKIVLEILNFHQRHVHQPHLAPLKYTRFNEYQSIIYLNALVYTIETK